MMKNRKMISLLLCAVLLLPLCVCAAEEDPVLMTVNGTEIRKSDADEYMYGYYINGYIEYYGDYTSVLVCSLRLPRVTTCSLRVLLKHSA